jgi:hypothetical protein
MARPLGENFRSPRKPISDKTDWSRYIDGQWWELVAGEDFTVDVDAFRNRVYSAANRKRMRARTEAGTDEQGREVLRIQFFTTEGEGEDSDGAATAPPEHVPAAA